MIPLIDVHEANANNKDEVAARSVEGAGEVLTQQVESPHHDFF